MALSPKQKLQFRNYLASAKSVESDLAFLLDNINEQIVLDWSENSLYWRVKQEDSIPDSLGGLPILEHLLGLYLGETIIKATGGGWVQCDQRNHRHGQPCIDGFGNQKWDCIYPVSITQNLFEIARDQPCFPGARSKMVLARQFQRAVKIALKNQR